jgi:hypothetical protein
MEEKAPDLPPPPQPTPMNPPPAPVDPYVEKMRGIVRDLSKIAESPKKKTATPPEPSPPPKDSSTISRMIDGVNNSKYRDSIIACLLSLFIAFGFFFYLIIKKPQVCTRNETHKDGTEQLTTDLYRCIIGSLMIFALVFLLSMYLSKRW